MTVKEPILRSSSTIAINYTHDNLCRYRHMLTASGVGTYGRSIHSTSVGMTRMDVWELKMRPREEKESDSDRPPGRVFAAITWKTVGNERPKAAHDRHQWEPESPFPRGGSPSDATFLPVIRTSRVGGDQCHPDKSSALKPSTPCSGIMLESLRPFPSPYGTQIMRLIALALTSTIALTAVAQEPKKNPFRDAFEKAAVQPEAAKPKAEKADPVKQGPKIIRAAEVGVGKLVPDVAFTDLAGKAGKLSDFKAAKAHGHRVHEHHLPDVQEVHSEPCANREGIRREGRRVPVRQPDRDRQVRRQAVRGALRSRHRRQANRGVRRNRNDGSLRPRFDADTFSTVGRSTTSTASATRSTPRGRTTSPQLWVKPSRASRP